MRIKSIVDEDFTNYKLPSMFIGTISCGGKCCIEAGIPLSVCQNDEWRKAKIVDIPDEKLIRRYMDNPYSDAIVFGGLEPFEQYEELVGFIKEFRKVCNDQIIIYTGYVKDELKLQIEELSTYSNIVIKFGRYIPNRDTRFDDVLGVTLASDNQYAERIS